MLAFAISIVASTLIFGKLLGTSTSQTPLIQLPAVFFSICLKDSLTMHSVSWLELRPCCFKHA